MPNEGRVFTAVSFFCGCGGLDLGIRGGFRALGRDYAPNPIRILEAYDISPWCVDAYRLNVGPEADVMDLSGADPEGLPAADLLFGGFPCQDFSTMGKRKGTASERGRLYRAMVRYMAYRRPLMAVGENVMGLLSNDEGRTLHRIFAEIREAGYWCWLWRLDAAEYLMPQRRKRVFIIAVRGDAELRPVRAPEPCGPMTAKEALADLEGITDESVPNQSQFSLLKNNKGIASRLRTPADRPAYTVCGSHHGNEPWHYSLPRRLSVRECARLQSFPDSFLFPAPKSRTAEMIGNAVPPVLGWHVARAVLSFLEAAGA
jgi:DNA (cytosine-5)-methyltransferase 1